MYNVTELMNTTNWGEYVQILDRESGYLLGVTLMVTTAIVLFITFYKQGVPTALTASGFVTSIAAIIMFATGYLQPHYIIIPVLMAAGGFISKMVTGGD